MQYRDQERGRWASGSVRTAWVKPGGVGIVPMRRKAGGADAPAGKAPRELWQIRRAVRSETEQPAPANRRGRP